MHFIFWSAIFFVKMLKHIVKTGIQDIKKSSAQNGYTAQCSVGVSTSIISLSVSPTSKTLNVGETVQLTGIKNPTSASEGTQWTSSNTGVATVSGSGLVTAKSAGTATITFKNSASTKSASCTIKVVNGDIIIGTGENGYSGGSLIKYDNSGNVQWSKSMYNSGHTVHAVVQTSDGGYIVGTGEAGYSGGSLIKYNSSGNVQWSKSMSNIGNTVHAIAIVY